VSKKDKAHAAERSGMPREQGESGEFVETLAPEDVLDVFDAVDGPVILSADVADHFGVTRETARRKLKQLADRGELDRRKVSRRVVYWRAGDTDTESGRTRGESAPATSPDPSPGPTPSTSATPHADAEESDRIGDALDGWEPDTQANARTARAQTRRAAEHLRAVGEYREKRELVDALADDSTLGARTWWERAVRPGLNRLADRGLVEYTRNRGWRWIGHVDRDDDAGDRSE
jgi:hypothetical protein